MKFDINIDFVVFNAPVSIFKHRLSSGSKNAPSTLQINAIAPEKITFSRGKRISFNFWHFPPFSFLCRLFFEIPIICRPPCYDGNKKDITGNTQLKEARCEIFLWLLPNKYQLCCNEISWKSDNVYLFSTENKFNLHFLYNIARLKRLSIR